MLCQGSNSCYDDFIFDLKTGYSGADMTNLCREAAIGPIRALEGGSIINISVSQVIILFIQILQCLLKLDTI